MTKKFCAGMIFSILLFAASVFAQAGRQIPPAPETKIVPVSYGIAVDNSGSVRAILDSVVEIVHSVVEENRPDDETFLVRFVDSSKINLAQDFTSSKDEIHGGADNLFIEGGQTAIYDALNFAARHLAENAKTEPNRRRVLVLITDGEDRASKTKIEDVLKFLKDEKIRVFTVGIADGKVFSKTLNSLSKETGGKSFQPKSKAEISSVAKELATAMRAQ